MASYRNVGQVPQGHTWCCAPLHWLNDKHHNGPGLHQWNSVTVQPQALLVFDQTAGNGEAIKEDCVDQGMVPA